MNETTQMYLRLNGLSASIISSHTQHPAAFGRGQARIDELSDWKQYRAIGREGVLLATALGEVAMGLYLLASGLYRPAFASLRLFLELGLASVHFSAHRLELQEWLKSAHDIKWSVLSNAESGVLSPRLCNAFLPSSGNDALVQLRELTETYRELSEYVHSNFWTVSELADGLQYREPLAKSWFKHFHVIADSLLLALYCRYSSELLPNEISAVLPQIQDHLVQCQTIRSLMIVPETINA